MEIGQKRPKDASNDVVGKNRIFKATLGPLVYLGLSRTTELKVLQKVVPMLQRKYVFELKWCLHYGENRSKLGLFKKRKKKLNALAWNDYRYSVI